MTNRRWLLALLLMATYLAVWTGILDASGLSRDVLEAWTQDPMGAEFRVNSYTAGHQADTAVASDANGNFVVVWESGAQDGSGYGVFGRRFSASGVARGSEFRANSFTPNSQRRAAVASDADGNFVVTWQSWSGDGSGYGVFGQRFNAGGLPQGSEFQVNSYTTNEQSRPAVASDANGNFVVMWQSWGEDGSGYGVFGQRFNAAGLPQGSEFQVNSYATGGQGGPVVASAANGDFVVAWTSQGQDGSLGGVFGQRFDSSGLPQGSEFQVNSYTTGEQFAPGVASDTNGSFVAVWQSWGEDGSGYGVFGQRFSAAGSPLGSEFQVNSYSAYRQAYPAVTSDASGNFVVVWEDSDGGLPGVFGRHFDASGVPQGSEFQVNSYTTSFQGTPVVASAANGNFVVAWESYGQDGDQFGIFGQRYGDLIFRDGFQ